MARKPKSFKLNEKNKSIILYTNVRLPEETDLINFYLDRGYTPMYEEKKPATKVEDMRKEMKDDKEALEKFNAIYAKKVGKDASKEEKKSAGFFGACKFYNEWKKNNKSKDEE